MKNVWSSDEKEMIDKGNELILLNLGFKHYDYKKTYPHTILIESGPYGWTNGDITKVYNKVESIRGQHWHRTIDTVNYHLKWDMLIPALSKFVDKYNLVPDELYQYLITNDKKGCWKYLVNSLQNGNR